MELLVVGIISGVIVLGVGSVLFFNRKPKTEIVADTGLDVTSVTFIINEAQSKIDILVENADKIRRTNMKAKTRKLVELAQTILNDLKEHPEDTKRARQFFNYYLDSALAIVKQYVELSEKGLQSASVEDSLWKVESLMDQLFEKFNQQRNKLVEDDLLSLDTEVTMLEKMIKLD